MYFLINLLGIFVFLGLAFLLSANRKEIRWRSLGILLGLDILVAWFFTQFVLGRAIIQGAAEGFNWLVNISYEGIGFVFPEWVHVQQMNVFVSALLPVLFIVPLFDLMTYCGFLPWVIKWLGKGLSFVSRQPRFESFFAIEMMFLGNAEALAVSGLQLRSMRKERDFTIALMSMNCISAAILGAYIKMMPAAFVLTAIPLNIINSLLISNIIHPVTVTPEEDTVAKLGEDGDLEREPLFSFLGSSIIGAGRLVLIITANLIAFVALAAFVNKVLGLFYAGLRLEGILGCVLFPFAWLMGLSPTEAYAFGQIMGTKIVTNEFVAMLEAGPHLAEYSRHYQGTLTVFVTSFVNFTTLGIVLGTFKGLVNQEKNQWIAKRTGYMLLAGILVSLLSAGIAGLFIW